MTVWKCKLETVLERIVLKQGDWLHRIDCILSRNAIKHFARWDGISDWHTFIWNIGNFCDKRLLKLTLEDHLFCSDCVRSSKARCLWYYFIHFSYTLNWDIHYLLAIKTSPETDYPACFNYKCPQHLTGSKVVKIIGCRLDNS